MASDKKHIFLASSAELRTDRDAFRLFVGDLNKRWHERGIFLEVTVWEDFDDAMSPTRKQDDYNAALRESDLFVMLYWTKVGLYTREEFETAHAQFKATGKPLVYTYCKDVAIPPSAMSRDSMSSLFDFKERLEALAHFPTRYDSAAALTGHFRGQLEDLAAKGFFGEAGKGELPAGPGTQVVGPGGVIVNGDNHGSIVTGSMNTGGGAFFGGPVSGQQVVGRDQINFNTRSNRDDR